MADNTIWKDCVDVSLIKNYYSVEYDYTGEGGELDPYDRVSQGQSTYPTDSEIMPLSRTYNYDIIKDDMSINYHSFSCDSWAIQFTTPSDNYKFSKLKYDFIVNTNKLLDGDLLYSVANSKENFSKYRYGTVVDENMISSIGNISQSALNDGVQYSITIDSLNLKPNTTYYLMLYLSTCPTITSLSYYANNSLSISYENIGVGYEVGIVHIDNGTEYVAYQCYIDNGSTFNQYQPYIDNGTSWSLCKT